MKEDDTNKEPGCLWYILTYLKAFILFGILVKYWPLFRKFFFWWIS